MSKRERRWPRKRFALRAIQDLPDHINLMALSRALDVSLATAQHWVATGLSARRSATRWSVRRADLLDFLRGTGRLIGTPPPQRRK